MEEIVESETINPCIEVSQDYDDLCALFKSMALNLKPGCWMEGTLINLWGNSDETSHSQNQSQSAGQADEGDSSCQSLEGRSHEDGDDQEEGRG